MRHDDDVFVRRAGQNAPDAGITQPRAHFSGQTDADLDRPSFHRLSQRRHVLGAERERGHAVVARSGLHLKISGNRDVEGNGGGPVFRGPLRRADVLGRMGHHAGHRHRLNQDQLPANVAAGEIGGRAEAHPHRLEVESTGGRRRRARRRARRLELERLPAAGGRKLPRGREPLRRQVEVLALTSCRPNSLNRRSTTPSTMSSYLVPAIRPHSSSPSALLVAETADDVAKKLLHPRTVDPPVLLFARRQRHADVTRREIVRMGHDRLARHPSDLLRRQRNAGQKCSRHERCQEADLAVH